MKSEAKAIKSYQDGHIKVRVSASAYQRREDVSASIAIDLDLDAARAFHADVGAAIEKEAARVKAKQDHEDRRKKWRDREVAAGRMKIFSATEFFK